MLIRILIGSFQLLGSFSWISALILIIINANWSLLIEFLIYSFTSVFFLAIFLIPQSFIQIFGAKLIYNKYLLIKLFGYLLLVFSFLYWGTVLAWYCSLVVFNFFSLYNGFWTSLLSAIGVSLFPILWLHVQAERNCEDTSQLIFVRNQSFAAEFSVTVMVVYALFFMDLYTTRLEIMLYFIIPFTLITAYGMYAAREYDKGNIQV